MNHKEWLKRGLMWSWYAGTLPYRWHAARLASEARRAPVMVLFYHRVADTDLNDWSMSRAMFARQMEWLSRRFEIVSLAEAQQRIARGFNDRPAVSITFDDGYAENCDFALPLLLRMRIPCTYFVSSRFVLENRPFPHDVALGKPLKPNTPRQIRGLAEAGIEIGAHTRWHLDLGKHRDSKSLQDEIIGSRDELQEITGRPVRYFAFPFGQRENLCAEGFRLAKQAGFAGVVSAYGGYNFPGDDSFHLQRIHGDPDMLRMKNWLSVDPRKLRTVSRFDYDSAHSAGSVPKSATERLCEPVLDEAAAR